MEYHTKYNICLLHHTLAEHGGEERMCQIVANELSQRGHNVVVVLTDQLKNEGIVYPLNVGVRLYYLQKNRVERKLNKWFVRLPEMRYRYLLKKHHIDVVIDVGSPKSLLTTKAAEGLNIKVICWDHFMYESFRKRWCYDDLKRLIMDGKIHRMVVLTQDDVNSYAEQEKGFPEGFVCHIYNPSPIQTDTYMPHFSKKVMACGRLANQKGFDLLLDAWREVEQQDSEWQLEIVGDGYSRQELEHQVSDNNLQRVTISHFTNQVKEKYAEAGVFVLSSRYEGLGLVLLEAESMSLPIVSFDCPCGPREIVRHGYNGYLAEPENPHDLAEKILAVIRDDRLREQMGRNAFEASRQFRTEKIIDQWERLINDVVAENKE